MRMSRKGREMSFCHFHSELHMGRNAIKVIKESYQGGMSMRPYDKGVINKTKPTFGFKVKVV
jgi:hypothetical protein